MSFIMAQVVSKYVVNGSGFHPELSRPTSSRSVRSMPMTLGRGLDRSRANPPPDRGRVETRQMSKNVEDSLGASVIESNSTQPGEADPGDVMVAKQAQSTKRKVELLGSRVKLQS